MNSIAATLDIPLPLRPPLHSEDPIDPDTLPSVQTIAHLALLLDAANAEYTYWGNRVALLANLLNSHKSQVIAQQEEEEKEAWERQLDDDAAAQLFAEMGIDVEAEREAESRTEREAGLQLLVEAGVLDESDEGWRVVEKTGNGLKKKSLVRPVVKEWEEEEEEEEPVPADLSTVMELTEVAEPAKDQLQEIGVVEAVLPKPHQTEGEVWEEAHGKARWTRRRSLRRGLKTMNDLRGSAKSQLVGVSNNDADHDNLPHLEPVRRQSLPAIRPAAATQSEEFLKLHHPPTPPPEPELESQKLQPKVISLPPPPPPKQPKRQTIPAYTPRLSRRLHGQAGPRTVSSTPHLQASAQVQEQAPLKPLDHGPKLSSSYPNQIHHQDENTLPSPTTPPPPPYQQTELAPSQHHQSQHEPQYDSKTSTISENPFTPRKLQALMLDLKTPIKQFLPLYASPPPRQHPSHPPQAPQVPQSRSQQLLPRKLSYSRSYSRLPVTAPATTSNKKDKVTPSNLDKVEAEVACTTPTTSTTSIPLYHNDNIEPPTPAGIKSRRKKYGYSSYGVARIVESRSRQYVKDDRWGWKAV